MRLGAHWVQTHGKSFDLLVGNKINFGAEELSNQGAGIIEAFDLLAGNLGEGRFSPISDEMNLQPLYQKCVSGSINEILSV